MVPWREWLQNQVNLSPQTMVNLAISLVLIIGLWLIRRWVLRVSLRRVTDLRVRYQWQKNTSYVYYALVVLLLFPIWFSNLRNLATYFGLLSAGLAIALRDPVTNFVGWIFIIWRRPFEVSDRIQIGEHAGDVIDQRIFQFTLLEIGNWVDADQSTGRMIHVPNGRVFTDAVANYSKGFEYIWNEMPVLVTFESDWRKAKGLLNSIVAHHAAELSLGAEEQVEKAAERFMIFYSTLTPIVYTSVEASGVLLTIRYMCKPRERRSSAQAIWEDILEAFDEHEDIEFAYPTQRFFTSAGA